MAEANVPPAREQGQETQGARRPHRTARVAASGPNGLQSYLTAEISASALRNNLGCIRRRLPSATRLCAVVKADCYGHGQDLLCDLLSRGSDALAVATPEEALHLRRIGQEGPILTFFSPCALQDSRELSGLLSELAARGVTLTLTCPDEIAPVSRAAQLVGKDVDVHVKIDSGMCRSGIRPERAGDLIDRIRRSPGLQLRGLYTHLAMADEPDPSFVAEQMQTFHRAIQGRQQRCILHAANSAGALALPETRLDMVRPGLALYGYQPRPFDEDSPGLRPCLRLTARLMQIKDVPAASRCGYGLTYRFQRASRIGLVPIGYGDGYLRCLSNRASMKICGKPAPVRGRISMDQTILDLTDVPEARVGDEVEIISNDPAQPHSVENLAALAGTIPYEITCLLGRRVRRLLVD
jgi:alanine racemase